MSINALIASPGFATWMSGEPLDAQRLLFTHEGKPRISIISIAHLNDAERMFIVTLVLNEVIAWMRAQSGTSSLRAILYMDEIFGFFPPTANPPSKLPMLTLLKQARAFGLGVVLATQNPVDLDYKGLANCGTWFIGRLQTERDKLRVIEGLKSALAGSEDGTDLEGLMSNLTQRVFLMRNVHDDAPVLMKTRWALSYLRGPLTGPEIARVMAGSAMRCSTTAWTSAQFRGEDRALQARRSSDSRPIPRFTPRAGRGHSRVFPRRHDQAEGRALQAHDRGLCEIALRGLETRASMNGRPSTWLAPLRRMAAAMRPGKTRRRDPLLKVAASRQAPRAATRIRRLARQRRCARRVTPPGRSPCRHISTRPRAPRVFYCDAFKSASKAGESEGDFRARLALAAREKRDAAVADLRKRWQDKLLKLQDQVRRAEERREREQAQLSQQQMQTAVSRRQLHSRRPAGPQGALIAKYRQRRHGGAFRRPLGTRITGRRRAPKRASKC